MRWRHAETVRDLGCRGQVHRLLSASGRLSPHVAVVDMGLQVTLGQVGTFASRHNTAHVEGTPLALFDALHWVCTVVHCEAEHRDKSSVTQSSNKTHLRSYITKCHIPLLVK